MLAAAGSFNPVALGLNLGGLGLSTALGNPFGGTTGRHISGAQLTSTHAASTSPGAHSPYSGPGQQSPDLATRPPGTSLFDPAAGALAQAAGVPIPAPVPTPVPLPPVPTFEQAADAGNALFDLGYEALWAVNPWRLVPDATVQEIGDAIVNAFVALDQALDRAVDNLLMATRRALPLDPAGGEEHVQGARESTRGKHEAGKTRKLRDRGGEKGDSNRVIPRRRPRGWKGPWPP